MKKIFLIGMTCILMSSLMLVAGQLHEPGTGIENPELREAGQGTGQGLEGDEFVSGGYLQHIIEIFYGFGVFYQALFYRDYHKFIISDIQFNTHSTA